MKECVVCNTEFQSKTSEKTCSISCRDIQHDRKKKEWLANNKQRVSATKKRWKDKTRSIRNKYDDVNKQDKQCVICQKEYIGHFQSTTCSKECRKTHANNRKRALAPAKVEVFKDCEWCSNSFKIYRSKQGKFCSVKCQRTHRNNRQPKKLNGLKYIEKNCEYCKKPYDSYLNIGKYCSKTCASKTRTIRWNKNNPIQPKDCLSCGTTFTPSNRSEAKYCSRKCAFENWAKQPKNKLNYAVQNAVRNGIKGIIKHSKYFEYIDFTMDELRIHLENQFDDWMNWTNHGLWHIDHIRPVASFNFTSMEDEDFKTCWALEYLQPLKDTEKMRKNHYYNKAKEMKE